MDHADHRSGFDVNLTLSRAAVIGLDVSVWRPRTDSAGPVAERPDAPTRGSCAAFTVIPVQPEFLPAFFMRSFTFFIAQISVYETDLFSS